MARTIRKGQIIAVTAGDYSDYYLRDHMRALRDFDPVAEAERFKPMEIREAYSGEDQEYIAWLIREAIVEPLSVGEVVELHVCSYGLLNPDLFVPAEES